MTTFLVVCNHKKKTVQADNPLEARGMIGCKKCWWFDLKESKWHGKDIRVYDQADLPRLDHTAPTQSRKKQINGTQLDWVG